MPLVTPFFLFLCTKLPTFLIKKKLWDTRCELCRGVNRRDDDDDVATTPAHASIDSRLSPKEESFGAFHPFAFLLIAKNSSLSYSLISFFRNCKIKPLCPSRYINKIIYLEIRTITFRLLHTNSNNNNNFANYLSCLSYTFSFFFF